MTGVPPVSRTPEGFGRKTGGTPPRGPRYRKGDDPIVRLRAREPWADDRVRPRGIVTGAATGRALYHKGSRPQSTGPDECKGDNSIARSVVFLADGSYVKQMVIGTLLGSRSRW
jgi:hypothetical protein